MPTSAVGRRNSGVVEQAEACSTQSGVTLIELLIVMAIVALLAGLSYPSAAAGLDSLRLRSAASEVASFLATAMDRAERRQQVVELRISPTENVIGARSGDSSFARVMELPAFVRIATVQPGGGRFLLYPGGTLPRITINLSSKDGRERRVVVDPITGIPRSEVIQK